MKPTYILKEVRISSDDRKKDGLELTVAEGDIILDKGFRFEVLPARFDFTKPITRRKASNSPQKRSERLLRIKELGEASAVVALLTQETHYENSDTLATKETENLRTIRYGESFCVLAKEQGFDMPATTYEFVIADASKPPEQKAQKFCTECGAKLTAGDKFCRECGAPVIGNKK